MCFSESKKMNKLKDIFKTNILSGQGTLLSKIVAKNLHKSNDVIHVDFEGIVDVKPIFFQEFLFPLVSEFDDEELGTRLKLINLTDDHQKAYKKAYDDSNIQIERLFGQYHQDFIDFSDITCEFLMKAREILKREPAMGQAVFGLDSTMGEIVANMNFGMIRRIANSGLICFAPRFSAEFAEKLSTLELSEIDAFLNIAGDMTGIYDHDHD